MPGQKKDQVRTVGNEAGGLEGRREASQGNPWPSHRHTGSQRAQAFTKLRHRVLVIPPIQYATDKEN